MHGKQQEEVAQNKAFPFHCPSLTIIIMLQNHLLHFQPYSSAAEFYPLTVHNTENVTLFRFWH